MYNINCFVFQQQTIKKTNFYQCFKNIFVFNNKGSCLYTRVRYILQRCFQKQSNLCPNNKCKRSRVHITHPVMVMKHVSITGPGRERNQCVVLTAVSNVTQQTKTHAHTVLSPGDSHTLHSLPPSLKRRWSGWLFHRKSSSVSRF